MTKNFFTPSSRGESPVGDASMEKAEPQDIAAAPLAAVASWGDTPTEKAIIAWVSKRVTLAGGTPLSRSTEVYNYLMEWLPELASMIDEENNS